VDQELSLAMAIGRIFVKKANGLRPKGCSNVKKRYFFNGKLKKYATLVSGVRSASRSSEERLRKTIIFHQEQTRSVCLTKGWGDRLLYYFSDELILIRFVFVSL
jgi:hypothetical protein